MISYDVLLQQMTNYVEQAKNTTDEQQLREQLTAIKALCDVVLQTPQNSVKVNQITAQPQLVQVPVMQPQMVPQAPTMQATKLQEADANGDSIFDF